MLKDITFGQYFPSNSIVHKLDARVKIILLILQIVTIFVCKNFISLGITAIFTMVVLFLTKIPFKLYFKSIKVIIPIIIFTAILNIFYIRSGVELFSFWKITIWSDGIIKAVFMASRVLILILISAVLTYATTPNDLTDGIERLLKPLKFIGLGHAVHTMSMMMTIALRFIPTLIEETDKIMSAQKARGADLETGSIVQKVKALLPILIPLLISSVRRAYELAEAMECRCYNGGVGRVRMKRLKMVFRDYMSILLCVTVLALIITFNNLF